MSEDEKEKMMMLHKQQHEEEKMWNTHSYQDIQENNHCDTRDSLQYREQRAMTICINRHRNNSDYSKCSRSDREMSWMKRKKHIETRSRRRQPKTQRRAKMTHQHTSRGVENEASIASDEDL